MQRANHRSVEPSRRAKPVIVAGLVLVGLVALVSGCSALDPSRGDAKGADRTYSVSDLDYSTGDCVIWDQDPDADFRETRIVPCTEDHILELSGPVEMSSPNDEFPGAERIDTDTDAPCEDRAEAFLGAPRLPNGRWGRYGLSISAAGWDNGERTYWCGLAQYDDTVPGGVTLRVVHTSAKGRGKHQVVEDAVGSCHRSKQQGETEPGMARVLPCSAPHGWQVLGTASFRADEPFPDAARYDEVVMPRCQALFDARVEPGHPEAFASDIRITKAQWAAGDRTATCVALGRDGELLTGSVLK